MTWACPKCGEEHSDEFDQCWNCTTATEPPGESSAPALEDVAQKIDRWLLILKIAACFASGAIGIPIALSPRGDVLNIFLALFVASIVCFWNRIHWIGPSIILGFCVGPFLFAPSIYGSGAQDINGAIIGSGVGFVIGCIMDFGFFSPTRNADNAG